MLCELNRLNETVLSSTQNKCYNIFLLSHSVFSSPSFSILGTKLDENGCQMALMSQNCCIIENIFFYVFDFLYFFFRSIIDALVL